MHPGTAVLDATKAQEAQGSAGQVGLLSTRQFLNYCLDIQRQPSWRVEADKAVDYYDGNQLDAETLADLQSKGMGPLIKNIIAPIVNVVLGMEAKTRSDWRVGADSDEHVDVAEALSAKLAEAERETRADRACSDGYAAQIKAGLGWAEVWRNENPFQYPYRTGFVHRRELFWDWLDQSYDLSKARYQVRKRWFDIDQAAAYFPKYLELFEEMKGDNLRYYLEVNQNSLGLAQAFDQNRGPAIEDMEDWISPERDRICLYECWYRLWVRGWVLRLPNGEVVELNMQNPVHVAILARGLARPQQAVYSKMRCSIWAGPVKIMDVASKSDYSPYVPFWGYREDRTAVPYGLVRAMISPQDEVNARRRRLLWLLGAKRVEMDEDALAERANTIDTMLREINRPDAVVVLNPARKHRDGFKVETDFGLAKQQYEVMKDSEDAVQQVVGVFNALLGRESQSQSGIAINSLVEQGTTALAEINDNYRYARRLVGERLLDLVREDLIGQQVTVMVGEQGKRKTVSLNVPAQHESGMQIVKNDVRAAKVKVALEDVPSTPSYRQQQLTMISEVMKGLPPDLQAIIAPFYFEATDLQKRRQMADQLRKKLGIVEPRTPEEEQALAQQQAEQQEMMRRAALLDLAERQAKVDKMNAETQKVIAEIKNNPELAGVRGDYETRIRDMETASREAIDQSTAELITTRQDFAMREQKLMGELSILKSQLAANAKDSEASTRKSEVEKEIALIEKERDIEVARINADAQKAVDGMAEQIAKLRQEMTAQAQELARKMKESEAKAREEQAKRDAKAAERAKSAEKKSEPAPAAPTVVVVGEASNDLGKTLKQVETALGSVAAEVQGLRKDQAKKPAAPSEMKLEIDGQPVTIKRKG